MRPKVSPARARALAPVLLIGTLIALGNSACLVHKHATVNPLATVKSEQPDKLLYDIAMKDVSKGKYTVARLNLQTLLNTYPNSEYLAQAKLAIANSWYQQGGIDGYAQAEAQYKDFITFFPAMKEAAEAQLRIAQIHYRQLQKADRDPTQAREAQAALRTFLLNYPDSALRPQALQMLRATQEVLAERIYMIGEFYLNRAHQGDYNDYRAAQNRLEETQQKYPLYSQGDILTDQLADSLTTTSKLYHDASTLERVKVDKDLYLANAQADKAHAIEEFSHLIMRYPMSPLVKDAQGELKSLHAPIPTPTAAAIAFNKEEIAGREKTPNPIGWDGWFGLKSMWSGRPATQIARADKVGIPVVVATAAPAPPPLPGLKALIHQTMVASGAIPASTEITAAATEANKIAEATNDPSPAAKAKVAPLAFQNVPTEKEQGADTPESNTPQAMTGNNFQDTSAVAAPPSPDANIILTPNELDMESRDETLADEIHRSVPAPLRQLKKGLQRQEQQELKLLQMIRKAEQKREKTAAPAAKTSGGSGGGR